MSLAGVNWGAFRDEALRHLQALVRIDTSNPPGNELPAAEYLARVLTAEGLAPVILQSVPGRANLVVRLDGAGGEPLMLLSHLDVVPANSSEWRYPPFGGDIADGMLWGRGVIDCKMVTVADLMTVLTLKRLDVALPGRLTMMAHADEESDFTYGMAWLTRNHRGLFEAPCALYEGGYSSGDIPGGPYLFVDTAEKGWCTAEVRLHGAGGHSAIPHSDNPLLYLGAVLRQLATPLPVHTVATVREYFAALAGHVGSRDPAMCSALLQLAGGRTTGDAINALPVSHAVRGQFEALLRNTATPVMLQSGSSRWALPTEAVLTLNGRLLPGQTAEMYERELRQSLGKSISLDLLDVHLGSECSRDTALFGAVERAMRRLYPDRPVVAQMLVGGSERGLLHELGVNVYGFAPIQPESEQLAPFALCHGPDERLSLANVERVCRAVLAVTCEFFQVSVLEETAA